MTDIKIVIGANAGDEGKGLMTDYFCYHAMQKSNKCLVVCSNGGAQRGHTVETPEGIRHVFHHFGSGTLVGADTYLSKQFILNPMIFREEYLQLQELGFTPKVYANLGCYITTPYDMILNQIIEDKRGENRHGSCGCGIWETIVRETRSENNELLKFRLDNVSQMYMEYLESKQKWHELKCVLQYFQTSYVYDRLREEPFWSDKTDTVINYELKNNQWYELLNSKQLLHNYIEDLKFMLDHIEFVISDVFIRNYDQIVFENGQGLLLDENMKEFGVHTTPSSTGIKNPLEVINNAYSEEEQEKEINLEVCYVSRTYLTRHGAGYLPDECSKEEISPNMETDLTNLPNQYQGTLRYGFISTRYLDKRTNEDYELCKNKFLSKKMSCATTHVNETNGKYAVSSDRYAGSWFIIEKYVSDGKNRESIMLNKDFRKKWGF